MRLALCGGLLGLLGHRSRLSAGRRAVKLAALVAAVVGFPLMRLSGAAPIATFALLVIIHRVLINWDEVTNGARTIFGIERFTTLWVSAAWGVLFVILAYWFRETSLGLKLRASREDEHHTACQAEHRPSRMTES